MFQKMILLGLLGMCMVAMVGTEAQAQFFDGWGWFCCSEVTGILDLSQVPNPNAKPSIVTVEGTLNSIEVMCLNPNGHDVLPGNAGTRLVATASAIGSRDITDRKRGFSKVLIGLGDLASLDTSAACVNPHWSVLQDSAAPKAMSITMRSFRCVPESNQDADPCFCNNPDGCGDTPLGDPTTEATPRDTVVLSCTLDPIQRDASFKPLHGQAFTCIE